MDSYALREAYGSQEPRTEEMVIAVGRPAVAVTTEMEGCSNPIVHPFYQQVPYERDPLTEPISRL